MTHCWNRGSCSRCTSSATGSSNGHRTCRRPSRDKVLALTEALPDSEERARAFAQLAFTEAFGGSDKATAHAESAVRLAELVDTT